MNENTKNNFEEFKKELNVTRKLNISIDEIIEATNYAISITKKELQIEKEQEHAFRNTILFAQAIVIASLEIFDENNAKISNLREDNIYFTIKQDAPKIKVFAGKFGEFTEYEDNNYFKLLVGDLVYCKNKIDNRFLLGLVLETPITSSIDKKHFIMLTNNEIIIDTNRDLWEINVADEENYLDFIKQTNGEFVEVFKYEVAK